MTDSIAHTVRCIAHEFERAIGHSSEQPEIDRPAHTHRAVLQLTDRLRQIDARLALPQSPFAIGGDWLHVMGN